MATDKIEAAIIAAVIKEAREALGWTRYQLAIKAGMQETHLKQIEEGAYCIRIDVLNKLTKALGIKVDFPIN